MGKISLVSAKYIIHASIEVDGVVDRPDIIGSVFGQTEGLLGNELELRELQSSGRIGRIEVETTMKDGKTSGQINIPSSMDKTETALIAAAVETIQRIGPCNAKVKVTGLEDVRAAKRSQVIDRAQALLSNLTHGTLPDSRDIKEKVSNAVRVADIVTYGREKLPAGPDIDSNDEVLVVEGRADVINLLKYDIKNAVAMNGTSVPKTIVDLAKKKDITVFLDGDRGGDLIVRELSSMGAEVKHVARAPDGKEVEEITHKEIHQSLRSKITFEEAMDRIQRGGSKTRARTPRSTSTSRPERSAPVRREQSDDRRSSFKGRDDRRGSFKGRDDRRSSFRSREPRSFNDRPSFSDRPLRMPPAQRERFIKYLDELNGSKEAYLLDGRGNVLGKVPAKEVGGTIQDLGKSAHTIVTDGSLTKELLDVAESCRVKFLVGTKSYLKDVRTRVKVLTKKELKD